MDDVRCLDTALPDLQKSVNRHIADGLHAELVESCCDVSVAGMFLRRTPGELYVDVRADDERKRLQSQAARGATGWLRAIPAGYHSKVPAMEMRAALHKLRNATRRALDHPMREEQRAELQKDEELCAASSALL